MQSRNPAILGAVLVLFIASRPGWSQESRGTILGRITDSSGLVVPGANVQITNVETSVMARGTTNEDGNYFFPYLIPGMYRIVAEKSGFKRLVRDGIQVNVNDRLEVNLALTLGTLSDTITVTAEAPLLNTTDASAGRTMDFREVRELPIEHADPDNIIRLSAGVAFTDALTKDQPWQSLNTAYAAIGSRQSRLEFTLDGASNTLHDVLRGSVAEAWSPPGDTVAEMKIQTMTFDVTTGQTEGMVVNYSLKSGTNKFHGSAYWGKQTPSMNANLFFANLVGTPTAGFQYDRIGGLFDGPVIIPKVYNGKNRTFFMFAYEHIKSNTDIASILTVPTAAERNGDFSALLTLGSNYQIYDPYTRVPTGNGRYTNQPLPGNIIPAAQISQIARNILTYYPMPDPVGGTATKDGGNNLNRTSWPSRIPYHTEVYKFDQAVSERTRLMFRANFFRRESRDTDYFGLDNPAIGSFFWNESAGFHLDGVHTFSPSLVMDVRLSDVRFVRAQHTNDPGINFDITKLGFPASLANAIPAADREFPTMTLNSEYTQTGPRTPLFKQTQTRNLAVSLDKIKGAHDIKFGGEYRSYPDNQTSANSSPTQATGFTIFQLNFTPAFTAGPLDNSVAAPRGDSLASMLYGLPSGGTIQLPFTTNFADNSNMWAGYAQDNWKVTRKLTLTLGLRYEREGAMWERYNRSVRGFDTTATLPFAQQVQALYAANPSPQLPAASFLVQGGLTFPGVNGQPRTLYNPENLNFMPRLGFAYSMNLKTVIRGGFGIYHGSMGTRLQDSYQYGFNANTNVVPTLDNGQTFIANIANPFPNGYNQPPGSSAGASTNVGNLINFFNPNPKSPLLRKFQVDIQRELPGGWALDVGYAGSRGSNLEVSRLLDPLQNQYLSTLPTRDQATINNLTAQVPNPFNVPAFTGTLLAGSVIARSNLLQPYPQFTSVGYYTYQGNSWYNGFNAIAQKRFSKGFTAAATYTFAKFMEQTALLNPGDALPSKVISDVDAPHHLILSGIYEFPFGKGRKFLSHLHGVGSLLVGGWQFSPIYTYQSGFPIALGNLLLTGGDENIVPLAKGQRSIYHWFNISAFNTVTSQQLLDNVRTLSLRFGNLRADAYNYWDASILKDTHIKESILVQFRFEAINALNQVTFSAPNVTATSQAFGQVTAQNNVPRHMQFTLRFAF